MTFLPKQYTPKPSVSNYFRYEDGENTIRILSSAITGFEYFNRDNKPVRSEEDFEEAPSDVKDGGKVKEFWAFVVWNYKTESIQIMEVTQKTIMNAILALEGNPKWGDVKSFDLTINKSGKSLETTYSVIPNPHSDVPQLAEKQYENSNIDLDKLYTGENPFGD